MSQPSRNQRAQRERNGGVHSEKRDRDPRSRRDNPSDRRSGSERWNNILPVQTSKSIYIYTKRKKRIFGLNIVRHVYCIWPRSSSQPPYYPRGSQRSARSAHQEQHRESKCSHICSRTGRHSQSVITMEGRQMLQYVCWNASKQLRQRV